ncbi:MAG: hypothetical protein H0T53_00425 [Herpetosiphonaceae bacterium]|nr:hypothetical protein [Herpetosiphonaceae bacterium]
MITELDNQPPIARLCQWVQRLDGWATFYETDTAAASQPSREPLSARDRAQSLYLLKERAMQTLYQSGSPAVRLGILEGPVSNQRIWLCENCVARASRQDMSPREYAETVGGCPECQREGREPDYFSLYVLQIDYGPLGRWQFHTPVPLGKTYLPAPRSEAAPVVGKRPLDHEGRMLRLGSALSSEQRREFPEAEVVFQVWQSIRRVNEEVGA